MLETNGDHKDEKLEAIQIILDGIKMSEHSAQNLLTIRKKFLLSGESSEYKNLAKFAEDTDSHLLWEKLEDSLKKAKDPWVATRAPHSATPRVHGWN